ncbi:UNVERIFIED_CONTAM: hypothetical protein FKN15_046553 [Acipenser sinensis]
MEAGVESVQDLDVQSNMSNVYKDRSSRWQDIQKGLQFIQSTLPYPGTEQEYEVKRFCFLNFSLVNIVPLVFIQDLVRKLFGEGNDVYREGDWARSLGLYTEALNIADYAESEDISIASENMEKLYANRAACHLNMASGAHDQVLEDCEKSLQHNENNYRALFRKSKSLKELGRHKEAYDAVAKCSLAVPHDENVIKLTRELAKKLGLKIRKAYVRAQCSKGLGSVEDIEMDLSDSTQESGAFPVSAVTPCSSEAESAQCESGSLPASIPVSSVSPIESHAAEEIGHPNGASVPFPVPESRLDYDADIIGDDLDDLLDNVASGGECRYPGNCTFAYCQEEIDVWTLERNRAFSRELLFDPFGGKGKVNLTVAKVLQEHHGIFMFLCEVCFDHKPRIISKRNQASPYYCSHPVTKHDFEENKCLVHILRETTVKYSKIRPRHVLGQFDLCRHEVRYGCVREDECHYAHSLIELKVWMIQAETGITPEAITLESKKYWSSMEVNFQGAQQTHGMPVRFGPPNVKIQFVCGQCWRNGQVSEPDKNKKYCTAKARHPWSKERRVVLVMSSERKKWTTIRPLPTKKPIPAQFDLCIHIASGKKCQYIGNCSFAHSPEERDMWTYMKDTSSEWSKERRVVLVMSSERKKWTTIRPLPTKKPIPAQFDVGSSFQLCIHIASGKKCQYIGNCSFAHSPEERDMWTYMKDTSSEYPVQDMEQLYELWLKSQCAKSEHGEEAVRQNGNPIHMPTDYAEEMAGYHCWLCGKNCNSEKQWQQHITSEKHKDKLFNSEDDQNCWQYRFPTGSFRVCERYLKGSCTEEDGCKLAHGKAELKEWEDRREFLLMKLAKARNDHLIAPNDNDFGKYSFLLKDIH